MKLRRKICTTLLASFLILAFAIAVPAEEPAQIDRVAMIEELVHQWGYDDTTAYQLRGELEQADDSKLLAVWQAESLDEINAILKGTTDLDGPLALGDSDMDYTFTPVTPCRIVDTRNAGGIMTAGSTRDFFAYGPGSDMTPQGGNAAGCDSPVSEPRGVMINVTAVPSGNGNLRAYAANVSTPTTSLVNYKSGVNIANAAAVKTYFAFGPKELQIYSSANSHVIIDVMGYYDTPVRAATPLNSVTVNNVRTVASGALFNFASPNCPTGYTLTGGGCHTQYQSQLSVVTRPNVFAGIPTNWQCVGFNTTGGTMEVNAIAVCSRVPGR